MENNYWISTVSTTVTGYNNINFTYNASIS